MDFADPTGKDTAAVPVAVQSQSRRVVAAAAAAVRINLNLAIYCRRKIDVICLGFLKHARAHVVDVRPELPPQPQ